ncbi:MAG: tetratricopeptide repeat protein [Bacteroidetes bacterium]|nr:tetratricopeptide repeat protein [Bacteroidota bacterium]
MKNHQMIFSLAAILFAFSQCKSGLVTMSNSCYDLIAQGQSQNKSGNYSTALETFNKVITKCDAYDAKEKGYAGQAAALNGLRQYNDALGAANHGLQIDKKSLDNLFEKANAELGLGMTTEAKADLNQVIQLTTKNQNTAQRATIYARMAEIDTRQGQYDAALQNIQQAISTDNSNYRFYLQKGDINVAAGNYYAAIASYDEAISKGNGSTEAWKAKTTSLVKLYQKKYKTDDAGTLNKKITAADRQSLCSAINTATQNGVQDMGIDLVKLSICK